MYEQQPSHTKSTIQPYINMWNYFVITLYTCVSTWPHHIFFWPHTCKCYQHYFPSTQIHSYHSMSSLVYHYANVLLENLKRTTFSALLCRHNWQCITQASWHTQRRHTPNPPSTPSVQIPTTPNQYNLWWEMTPRRPYYPTMEKFFPTNWPQVYIALLHWRGPTTPNASGNLKVSENRKH